MESRFSFFLGSLILVGLSLLLGLLIAFVYTKTTGKTFGDLHKHYWTFFIVLGFIVSAVPT
tara:strand:+ start:3151 stop:3333 length:183 start_codon:yes stop_codon:yes gene_type:complete